MNPILLTLNKTGEVWNACGGSKQELGCREKRLEKGVVGQVVLCWLPWLPVCWGWRESREREKYSGVGGATAGVSRRVEVNVFVILCFTEFVRYVWNLEFLLGELVWFAGNRNNSKIPNYKKGRQ